MLKLHHRLLMRLLATTPAPEAMKPGGHHERHPELHKAMRKLRGAEDDLEKAAHDYGGHKAHCGCWIPLIRLWQNYKLH